MPHVLHKYAFGKVMDKSTAAPFSRHDIFTYLP